MIGDWAGVVIAVLAADLVVIVLTFAYLARKASRRRGRWTALFERSRCAGCGEPAPVFRLPRSLRQAIRVRRTCESCGLECDAWGDAVGGERA